MGQVWAVAGVCCWLVVAGNHEAAAQDYDNPTMAGAPCVLLNSYEVEPTGGGDDGSPYRASATIENICGRTLEVQFCFAYAPNDDGVERNCFQGPVRPWATSQVVNPETPFRITGSSYEWRYLP